MDIETVTRLLKNSGLHVLGADRSFIYIEDPSCIMRSFETFATYAWAIITFITGMLIFGWAISMIRGAKNDIFTNMRNLIMMFGILSVGGPIINLIYGDDLFKRGCRTIKVPMEEVDKLLAARNSELKQFDQNNLYEEFDIYDSGAPHETTYADAPITDSGAPENVSATASDDTNVAIPTVGSASGSFDNSGQSTANMAATTTTPTGAIASGKDVIYTNPDGTRVRRTGGTRAWRNNNPGCIKYSDFTRRMGAIGVAGNFAVFPDEETGMRAISALLRTKSYNNLSIANAIAKWAPREENDVARYRQTLHKQTGLDLDRKISDLSAEELDKVAHAIRTHEGWKAGSTVPAD